MKILLVSHYFLPRHRAGVEIYTYRLAKELGRKDSAWVYCREDGYWDREFHEEDDVYDGVPVHRVYYSRRLDFRAHYDNPYLDEKFERYLRWRRPDVIHFQHLDRLSAGFMRVAHRLGIASLLTLHDFWFMCPQIQMLSGAHPCGGPSEGGKCASCPTVVPDHIAAGFMARAEHRWRERAVTRATLLAARRLIPARAQTLLRRRLASSEYAAYGITPEATRRRFSFLREAFGLVDIVLTPSRFVWHMFQQAGFEHPRVIYSDNGIPEFRGSGEVGGSSHVRFGYFSAVIPHKGIELLIRAFREVRSPDVRLRIQGQGNDDYLAKVRQLAGNDLRITFHDPYGEGALAEAFSEIDILVVPSLWYENSPIVIHEAAMADVPVIAADIGGMAEYVRPGENGVLFRFGDAQDLRRKLELFVEDRTLRSRLNKVPFRLKMIEEDAAELRQHYAELVCS